MLRATKQFLLIKIARLLSRLFLKLTITGWENLPPDGPLIVISNHFSWFEPPLLAMFLPYKPAFFAAAELSDQHWLLRLVLSPFRIIPVRRGQVDRTALRTAVEVLEESGVLVIFPEGGIDPDLQEVLATGRPLAMDEGQNSRLSAELAPARPGTAYLAERTSARILPVAFLGTELVLGNLPKLRRTSVQMHIGPAFGPLTIDENMRGQERRRKLDDHGDVMMRSIAALMPPENRGPYT